MSTSLSPGLLLIASIGSALAGCEGEAQNCAPDHLYLDLWPGPREEGDWELLLEGDLEAACQIELRPGEGYSLGRCESAAGRLDLGLERDRLRSIELRGARPERLALSLWREGELWWERRLRPEWRAWPAEGDGCGSDWTALMELDTP